jgi:hypothetical protein
MRTCWLACGSFTINADRGLLQNGYELACLTTTGVDLPEDNETGLKRLRFGAGDHREEARVT